MPMPKAKILIGKTFGRLTIIKEVEPYITKDNKKIRKVLCKCSCGTYKKIIYKTIKQGDSTSCGCLAKSLAKKRQTKHGYYYHYIYRTWQRIKDRCINKKGKDYPNYGGRGISVYSPWIKDFIGFKEYVFTTLGERPTPKHSIDRIDNNSHYMPDNIRWADQRQQTRNRRVSPKYKGLDNTVKPI